MLPSLVKDLPCPLCTACSLTIRVANCNLGIVSMLETYCTTCEQVVNSTHSSDRVGASHSTKVPFTVTRSAVLATMDMGVGNAGLVKFCRCLDTPAMHHKTYSTHSKAITTASMEVVTDVLCESAQIVRKVYKDLDPSIDESGVIDLTVSFDGSWMTRGHKSLYGIGCIVEVVTGLVIDFAVLSLYCQSCSYASKRHGGKNTAGFQQWHERHTDCNCNYHGSSGGMEVAAAEICGSVLSSPIVSAIRRCCRMVTRAPTSTCVICACMAVMSRLRRRNASTTLPRGWARHSANWHQRGKSLAQLSVDVGMGN